MNLTHFKKLLNNPPKWFTGNGDAQVLIECVDEGTSGCHYKCATVEFVDEPDFDGPYVVIKTGLGE